MRRWPVRLSWVAVVLIGVLPDGALAQLAPVDGGRAQATDVVAPAMPVPSTPAPQPGLAPDAAVPSAAVPSARAPNAGLAPLTLDAVLASTEKAHPLMLAADLDRDAAASETLSAEGGFDASWKTRGTARPVGYYDNLTVDSVVEKPTALWGVSTFAGWRLGTGEFPDYDEKLRTLDYGQWRAGVNIPVLRNGPVDRRRASLARAELTQRMAQLSYEQQRIELRRLASHRYWAWVAAGRKLDVAEALLENVRARQAAVAARVRTGDLPSIEEADNARALEQRHAQEASAWRSLEQTAIELSLFVRNERGEPTLPRREQLPNDWPDTAARSNARVDTHLALERRPEPKRLQLQRQQHDVELEFTENQLLPALDLQVAGARNLGASLPERPDLEQPVVELSLLLDVPLQNRSNEGRARALRAQIERTSVQQRFAAERVVADVQDAYSAVERAKDRIGSLHREVQLALELEAAERERFAAGDSQLLIVNLREQQTAEARLRQIDALFDYHRALADLRAARGD